SPNYPDNYPQNIDCVWVVTVPNGEAVQLDFEGDFFIEPSSRYADCLYDYLELRDGATSDATLIARLCGQERPSTHKSTGTTMYLRFRTDNSFAHKGFKVKYSIATCGGRYFGQSGVLHSPGFPDANYPDNSECEWYLQGPTGHYLTISFTSFHLQDSEDCTSDYCCLLPLDSDSLDVGCGRTVRPHGSFMNQGGSLSTVFTSWHYTSQCGGDLNAASGTISSPNYPNLYPHYRFCTWRITVPVGRRVTLTIIDLRLEQHVGCNLDSVCNFDSVTIMNGASTSSPVLGRYCGTNSPGTVHSGSNKLLVVFISDHSVVKGGFYATWSTDSTGEFLFWSLKCRTSLSLSLFIYIYIYIYL
uniref:CUB domain-containing protein n=1 Tax=Erpetoichthys calabaricus TaxID=27687 RepID=A0A8C4RUP8_ERPCA